ncbi:peptidoglycan-associated lipoprotein [Tahibacter aquaticus]|uniref:Peptidoglycan-associated lipoprotein n=1 Tax=Tahibacter aquaticus TaxID=520092 RepID=A0A4V3DNJ1_9GAMM|nr:peptidoglycan-associated lipoprotein Pal [Tahibacter aquaticus]TDR48656.1 peptidoglycan-associated lipoprotein [Tahibacter aquaticus]
MNTSLRLAIAALLCVTAVGCAKKAVKTQPSGNTESTSQPTTGGSTEAGGYKETDLTSDSCLRQRVIYFDLDKTEIKGEFQAQIACHSKFIRQFPNYNVTLEGNADERGSREYNLGLGERRGNAVQSGLSSAGAPGNQLNVVSYGEERPTCKDHSEDCWSKNRRVEIVYTKN